MELNSPIDGRWSPRLTTAPPPGGAAHGDPPASCPPPPCWWATSPSPSSARCQVTHSAAVSNVSPAGSRRRDVFLSKIMNFFMKHFILFQLLISSKLPSESLSQSQSLAREPWPAGAGRRWQSGGNTKPRGRRRRWRRPAVCLVSVG